MVDSVIVINQYSNAFHLKKVLPVMRNAIIVSTHALFDIEKNEFEEIFEEINLSFYQFDSWNERSEDTDLDKEAYDKSKKWLKYTSIYQRELLDGITYVKNKFVYDRLKEELNVTGDTKFFVFCQSYDLMNLGISYKFWNDLNADIIQTGPLSKGFLLIKKVTSVVWIRYCVYILRAFFLSFKPTRVKVYNDSGRFYLMSTKRITIKSELSSFQKWIIPVFCNLTKSYLAAPIHSSTKLNSMYPFLKRKKMVMVQDAFRPTTYPPYYYALSFFGSMLVPLSGIDKAYFQNAGIDVFPLNTLINKQRLKANESKNLEISTICLTLNHSGNWSSLISRSDTDGLIIKFVELAKHYPSLNFIIRLHPNSDQLKGEGVGWINRIKHQVGLLDLKNLSVSSATLEEDWQRAQVFISEYSLSAVEALRFGKIVLFLNLTQRKSFVKDLTDVGFIEANSYEALIENLDYIADKPNEVNRKLIASIDSFNQLY